jgi:hypothetical protein
MAVQKIVDHLPVHDKEGRFQRNGKNNGYRKRFFVTFVKGCCLWIGLDFGEEISTDEDTNKGRDSHICKQQQNFFWW